MQVLVSQQGSSVYHVFKSEVQLPKFCMYCPADAESLPAASSSVRFSITERPARSVACPRVLCLVSSVIVMLRQFVHVARVDNDGQLYTGLS